MMRSMQSAVTGLRAQQTAMDVIGNNIANVNTYGFKASTTNFSDLFYQTLNNGNVTVNPSQVGYGSLVGAISKNMSSVGASTTDNATDLYIDGQGFFALNTEADGSGKTYYTRVGNFHFSPNGYLVDNATGNYVLSNKQNADGTFKPVQLDTLAGDHQIWIEDANGNCIPITNTDVGYTDAGGNAQTFAANFAQLENISIDSDGSITASIGDTTGKLIIDTSTGHNFGTYTGFPVSYTALTTAAGAANLQREQVGLSTFLNPDGLTEIGNNFYIANESSGPANATTAGNNNSTVIRSGRLEMSNVDVAKEFTNMITTQRGFQANSRVITVSDGMLEELVNLKRS